MVGSPLPSGAIGSTEAGVLGASAPSAVAEVVTCLDEPEAAGGGRGALHVIEGVIIGREVWTDRGGGGMGGVGTAGAGEGAAGVREAAGSGGDVRWCGG